MHSSVILVLVWDTNLF